MDAHPMIDFIRNHPVASLATIDGDAARCRGFLTNLIDEKLYFTTGASKAVYSQLLAHPNVELAYFSPDFSHALRVRGTVTFDDDRTKKAQLIQQRDYLKGFHPDDPEFILFYIGNPQGRFWTMADNLKEAALPWVPVA